MTRTIKLLRGSYLLTLKRKKAIVVTEENNLLLLESGTKNGMANRSKRDGNESYYWNYT